MTSGELDKRVQGGRGLVASRKGTQPSRVYPLLTARPSESDRRDGVPAVEVTIRSLYQQPKALVNPVPAVAFESRLFKLLRHILRDNADKIEIAGSICPARIEFHRPPSDQRWRLIGA